MQVKLDVPQMLHCVVAYNTSSVTLTCKPLDLLVVGAKHFSRLLRLLKACEDDGLNVAVPMRMLEVFRLREPTCPFYRMKNMSLHLLNKYCTIW